MPVMCNTKEGIWAMLRSLNSFNTLIKIRAEAGQNEDLDDFYILGRFFTHRSGHFIKWTPDFFPPEMYATIPPVLTPEEFNALVNQFGVDKNRIRHGDQMHLPVIPPAHLIDPISRQGWTVQTCHDAYPVETGEDLDLEPYIGQTIREVKNILEANPEKIYVFEPLRIFNADLVDVDSPEDSAYGPMREPGLRPDEDMHDDYIVQYGDAMDVRVIQFFHKDTHEIYLNRESQSEIDTFAETIRIFCESRGFTGVEAEFQPIPCHVINYESGATPSRFSWHVSSYFRVQTHQGSFGIMIIKDMTMCLDLMGTEVTAYDLCETAGLLIDRTKISPHFCMIMAGIVEALCEKMNAMQK